MFYDVLDYFLIKNTDLIPIDFQIRHIHKVYASPLHLFAVSSYRNESELVYNWKRAAQQLAFKIQRTIPPELDALRWDMYLLLCVEEGKVSTETRKLIENNRFYFRKIVLTKDDEPYLQDRLPISLSLNRISSEESLLFDKEQFLAKLKECLEPEFHHKLNERFFIDGVDSAEKLLELIEIRIEGETTDAD